jgi:hypothetical protein
MFLSLGDRDFKKCFITLKPCPGDRDRVLHGCGWVDSGCLGWSPLTTS